MGNSLFPGQAFINTSYEKDRNSNRLFKDTPQNTDTYKKVLKKTFKPKHKVDQTVKMDLKQKKAIECTMLSKKSVISPEKILNNENEKSANIKTSLKYSYPKRSSFLDAKRKISNQLSLEKENFCCFGDTSGSTETLE